MVRKKQVVTRFAPPQFAPVSLIPRVPPLSRFCTGSFLGLLLCLPDFPLALSGFPSWPSGYSLALSRVFPASGTCGPHRPSLSPTGPPSTLTFTNRAPFDPHSHKPFPGWRPPGGLLRTAASGAAFFGPSPSDCVGPRCGGAIAGRSRPGVVSLGPRWHFLRPACRAR